MFYAIAIWNDLWSRVDDVMVFAFDSTGTMMVFKFDNSCLYRDILDEEVS